MYKHLSITTFGILILILAGGCSSQPRLVEQFYGTSFELAKESQIYNPAAGIASGPPLGLEGNVAASVIERYEQGFEKAAPKTETYSVSFEGMTVK